MFIWFKFLLNNFKNGNFLFSLQKNPSILSPLYIVMHNQGYYTVTRISLDHDLWTTDHDHDKSSIGSSSHGQRSWVYNGT